MKITVHQVCLAALLLAGGASAAEKPNVLFIAVDDLRPALGCYGVEQAQTPHMDSFAESARLFKKHYVQVPTCGASRYSMLTGTIPRTKAATNNNAGHAVPSGPSEAARTMPELFRNNGYRTVCFGKISHSSTGWRSENEPDVPGAWDEILTPTGNWKGSLVVAYSNGRDRDEKGGFIPLYDFPELEDNELPDGMMADAVIERLGKFAESGEPFFMGVGFFKPHLPFVAPKKYKDRFNGVAIPSPNGMKRGDTRKVGKSSEFYKYVTNRSWKRPAQGETISEEDAQEVRRAYFACVSYVDAQIGRVLRALEEAGLAENTVVVLWGDHGWHLGENNAWAKHTPLEKSQRSVFMLRTPDLKKPGVPTESLAATLDIYPTLVDLCALENRRTAAPLDGVSLRPVLEDPAAKVRAEALSFWYSTSMTDGRYRLIVSKRKESGEFYTELYDHRTDPGELVNVANKNPELRKRLMAQLKRAYPQLLIQ